MANNKELNKVDRSHGAFRKNADAFYDIVMEGLKGEVDGEHFWDAVAEDAVFEFMYHFPGFTTKLEGRKAYMDWFAGYTNELTSGDNLRVYKDKEQGVVTLEYQVHGTILSTGNQYDNRFCSVVTIKDRKIVYWRDYMDSLATMNAMVKA